MLFTLMLLQLASLICASCEAGVRLDVDPNGEIIEDIARFNLDGVLLKDSARPTCDKTVFTCLEDWSRARLINNVVGNYMFSLA